MASAIQGPGVLWVTSRISDSTSSILSEKTFLKWYDEDHIAEIVSTSGIKNAFRYIDVNKGSPNAPKPFLAFYPMEDLAFTQGQEFKGIKVKSDILPGSGIVYDFADLDVSYLGLVQSPEGKAKPGRKIIRFAKRMSGNKSQRRHHTFLFQQSSPRKAYRTRRSIGSMTK